MEVDNAPGSAILKIFAYIAVFDVPSKHLIRTYSIHILACLLRLNRAG